MQRRRETARRRCEDDAKTTRRRRKDDANTTQRRREDDEKTMRRRREYDAKTMQRRREDNAKTTRRRREDDAKTTRRRREDDAKMIRRRCRGGETRLTVPPCWAAQGTWRTFRRCRGERHCYDCTSVGHLRWHTRQTHLSSAHTYNQGADTHRLQRHGNAGSEIYRTILMFIFIFYVIIEKQQVNWKIARRWSRPWLPDT